MKIGVLGSANLDTVVETKYIPKPGETVEGTKIHHFAGGKGANQAIAAAKLGAEVTMFTCVGNDSAGHKLLTNFNKNNVNTEYVHIADNQPTGTAFITLGNGENSIVVVAGANNSVNKNYIDSIESELLKTDIILLQNEIPKETNEYVIDLCYKHRKTIIYNPAPARSIDKNLLKKIDYLTPNEHELKIIFGDKNLESILEQYPEKLLVTEGEKGVSTFLRDFGHITIPAEKVKVIDTTGAGDTFNGAFAFAISTNIDFINAIKFANKAAGISIGSYGAQEGMPDYSQMIK